MATAAQQTAPRKQPQKLSLRDQLAMQVAPAIYASAGFEILNQKDGRMADRVIHISREFADRFLGSVK